MIRALLALFIATCLTVRAEEPALEKVDLFIGGEDGYTAYRIPGMVVTPKGAVLAYCEARRTSSADWGDIEVLLRRSVDGGKTWDPPRKIAHKGAPVPRSRFSHGRKYRSDTEQTVNNPAAVIEAATGRIYFLYCIEYGACFVMHSDDDGVSWSEPADITSTFDQFRPEFPWTVIATGPGHGIQLKSGRLVMPVWLSSGAGGKHRPSVVSVIFSDDRGTSWRRGAIAIPNNEEFVNPSETTAVELSDGTVMLNARNESKPNRRLIVTSPDGATSWSAPQFDEALLEPICLGSLLRLPTDSAEDRLLFANPHSLKRDANGNVIPGSGPRGNLSIKLSNDGGKTWPIMKTLEPGPSAYSDLASLPDGTVLCFYERGTKLTIARIDPHWLLEP